MADLNNSIKSIIKGYIENESLTDYRIGTVVSDNPLKIRLSERLIIDEDQIFLTEAVIEKVIDVTHNHEILGSTNSASVLSETHSHRVSFNSNKALREIKIQEGLNENDKVLLLSVSKGQIYIILSKIRDKKSIKIDNSNNWTFK